MLKPKSKKSDNRVKILSDFKDKPSGTDASRLVNLGYNNFVLIARVLAILSPESSPMKRLKDEARKRGQLVDATQGRKTRSIIVTDNNHVFLSGLTPETLSGRFANIDREE